MSNTAEGVVEDEVKSFHLAGKEHSFHLEGTHKGEKAADDSESAGSDDEVKSFHLTGNEHSFKKE